MERKVEGKKVYKNIRKKKIKPQKNLKKIKNPVQECFNSTSQ